MEPGLALKYGVVPLHPSSWGHGLGSQLGGSQRTGQRASHRPWCSILRAGGASGRGLGDSSVPAPHPLPLPLLHCLLRTFLLTLFTGREGAHRTWVQPGWPLLASQKRRESLENSG